MRNETSTRPVNYRRERDRMNTSYEDRVATNTAVMKKYFDLLFTQNMDQLFEPITDDIEWRVIPTGDVFTNKDEFERLARNHWSASPDRTKKLVNLFASNEYACLEYITGGTLTGRADFQRSPSNLSAGTMSSNAASCSTCATARSTGFTNTSTSTPPGA
jgi:hypothetical protein